MRKIIVVFVLGLLSCNHRQDEFKILQSWTPETFRGDEYIVYSNTKDSIALINYSESLKSKVEKKGRQLLCILFCSDSLDRPKFKDKLPSVSKFDKSFALYRVKGDNIKEGYEFLYTKNK
jgi:hypothetical protein